MTTFAFVAVVAASQYQKRPGQAQIKQYTKPRGTVIKNPNRKHK